MIYLKTYFYSEHEVPFLMLNLLEAYPYIDKFIICEYNYTHTGLKRKYIWNDIKHQLPHNHNCTYNYKKDLKQKITINNPKMNKKMISVI